MRAAPLLWLTLLLTAGLTAAGPERAHADIYTYTDEQGVVHFTNIDPKHHKTRRRWKTAFKTAPDGKASAVRGDCERCDAVPARDGSKERYRRYDAFIAEASELYAIPEILIRAVIKSESDYDPRVVSRVGARGLMQLMPSVCKDMDISDPHDPRANIMGGTRLLRVLANRFEGDLVRVVAAYHAGAGAVRKYDGIPPYENTQKYVRIVLKRYYDYKTLLARNP